MVWQEVLTAQKENRHEIKLTGAEINKQISENGLDKTLFTLINLNYLSIHETSIKSVPDEIEQLINLQTLVLHSNKLDSITTKISRLSKLKILDLSGNLLKSLPEEFSSLSQLVTLNISNNQLENMPKFQTNSKLTVINVSNNNLIKFPDVCYSEMTSLSELYFSNNKIEIIPNTIGVLTGLKILLLNSNEIKEIPGELSTCNKLKDLNLKENPISDKRLNKLIIQGHSKKVIDYIKQHYVPVQVTADKTKKAKKTQNEENHKIITDYLYKINTQHFTDESLKVILQDSVKNVRPHLIACLILNLTFTDETFKKFIQLQTKLHDTVCEKRNAATIATHDATKLVGGDIVYTAVPPSSLLIKPLNSSQQVTGAQLFKKLQIEADNIRKEKKRNVYTGIHKYLHLLEGKSHYPCLLNSNGEVISFPPITNSDVTKMTTSTTSLLIEVTGASSQSVCKKVADTLIKEMLPIFGNLTIQQVRNVDIDGNLKSVYPSRTDLVFDDSSSIFVQRD